MNLNRTGMPLFAFPHASAWRIALAAIVIGATVLGAGAKARADAVSDCDRLAAHPLDPQRTHAGLVLDQIDAPAAMSACRRAVEANPDNARLQYQYGRSLHKGQSYVAARMWYRKAADQDYAPAQYNLGVMYESGLGVAPDSSEAVRWYRLAVAQGYAPAKERLASLAPPAPPPKSADEGLSTGAKVGLGIAAAAVLLALAAAAAGDDDPAGGNGATGAQTAPPCGQEYWIKPSKMPCGSQWKPRGQWPKRYWCYTDYNMEIHGSSGVTYCTNGAGVWERSALLDRCNGVEGWCNSN
jgi:hypothetical protein